MLNEYQEEQLEMLKLETAMAVVRECMIYGRTVREVIEEGFALGNLDAQILSILKNKQAPHNP